MTTECFAPVRGSALRLTGLTSQGRVPDVVTYVTSKSVVKVTVSEVVDGGGIEVVRNPDEKARLKYVRAAQTLRHKVDIEFLRVDPALLGLITGAEVVYREEHGFGKVPFGIAPFGGALGEAPAMLAEGFDVSSFQRPTSFALEVWSKLDGTSAKPRALGFDEVGFDTTPFDTPASVACGQGRRWGYTLFPFLRGGRVSGFKFANGLVSFNLVGAQTRRNPGWGVGPHDLTGPFQRLDTPVSRGTSWRMFVTEGQPPAEECGLQYIAADVLDNGTAANPMPDPDAVLFVDGGGATDSAWIIDGGRA